MDVLEPGEGVGLAGIGRWQGGPGLGGRSAGDQGHGQRQRANDGPYLVVHAPAGAGFAGAFCCTSMAVSCRAICMKSCG